MVPFFCKFDVCNGASHGDLLMVNALALAARKDIAELVHISRVDESTVRVQLPTGKVIQGSDWDNISSAILAVA